MLFRNSIILPMWHNTNAIDLMILAISWNATEVFWIAEQKCYDIGWFVALLGWGK